MLNLDNIRILEHETMLAWQALEVVQYDGWTLRFAHGYSGRANSVNPLDASSLPLDEKIAFCEAWYKERNLPPLYRLNAAMQPSNLEETLEALGYVRFNETIVQVLDLSKFSGEMDSRFTYISQVEDDWLADWGAWTNVPAIHIHAAKTMLSQSESNGCYARIEDKALGLGLANGAYMGLFDIVVSADARQQGLGYALVSSLLAWAKQQGVKTVYLQVTASNSPAIALYKKLGFEEHHRYWYRKKA